MGIRRSVRQYARRATIKTPSMQLQLAIEPAARLTAGALLTYEEGARRSALPWVPCVPPPLYPTQVSHASTCSAASERAPGFGPPSVTSQRSQRPPQRATTCLFTDTCTISQ
jgi:hypothetical protein